MKQKQEYSQEQKRETFHPVSKLGLQRYLSDWQDILKLGQHCALYKICQMVEKGRREEVEK